MQALRVGSSGWLRSVAFTVLWLAERRLWRVLYRWLACCVDKLRIFKVQPSLI